MVEILVASLCIGGYKCDQASKAYFAYNPRPQIYANKLKNDAAQVVGEQTLIATSTLVAISTQKTYQIKINKYFSFGKTSQGVELRYGLSF